MARSLTLTLPGDQTAAVAAGFTAVAGFDGRVYENAVSVDAGAVAVALAGPGTNTVTFSNLPDLDDAIYAVTFKVPGGFSTQYYPEDSPHFPFRVIPFRSTAQTIASMEVRLYRDDAEVVGGLNPAVEGVAGLGDWVITGWGAAPLDADDYDLTFFVGGVRNSFHWRVLAATDAAPAGAKAVYSIGADLDVFGSLDDTGRLSKMLQDQDQAAILIDRARCQAEAEIDASAGICYTVPLHRDLAGTWDVSAGLQQVTGTGGKASSELRPGQLVVLGDETREILGVTSDDAFSLKTAHVGGVSSVVAKAVPKLSEAFLRRWSSVLTIYYLAFGSEDIPKNVVDAVSVVREQLGWLCQGRLKFADIAKTDALTGFGFAEAVADPTDPLLRLRTTFQEHTHGGSRLRIGTVT
jgi:hypothetical protein